MENCKKCGQPLSEFLIKAEADWHIMCFPEDEWKKWMDRYNDDPVR